MAAVATTETVKIVINDIPLEVPKGELIVESVKRLGLEIPIFCYHPRMKPVGMCRMCLVEVGFLQPDGSVRKMPKPQAGCTLPASDGMVVYTDTEMVHRDRKGVLEFLLINHPLDCPICDRGGECPLQNNTLFYGPSTSRYVEIKRHLPKAFPLSQYVTLDLERCIQCGRCVRFTEEISGDSQLAFRFRGAEMQPSTFELRDFNSKFSGNVIEICPVGALTSAKYRFRARPWDLETKPGVCTVCSNGCNIWFDYRVGKMVRINGRTNEVVNEEWTCDRGKFGHEFYNAETRLTAPLLRSDDKLVSGDWSAVYAPILDAFSTGEVAALVGPQLSNEALFLANKLFREHFKSDNLDHRFTAVLPSGADRGLIRAESSIASLEDEPAILVFGTSLADELPIVHLRVRKAWFQNGARVVVAHDSDTETDAFAHLVLRYNSGTASTLAWALEAEVARLKGAGAGVNLDEAAAKTGVAVAKMQEAAKLLAELGGTVITSRGTLNDGNGLDVLKSLSQAAAHTGARFNCYALGANEQGATELGFMPQGSGMDTHAILNACAEGRIKALWLVGVDPFDHDDRELVEKALENVEFLVYQGIAESEAMAFASVVLPMAAPAEQDGTWTNCERRVQRFLPVLGTKGQAKPAWRIFSELMLRAAPGKPAFNTDEVLGQIAANVPAFADVSAPRLAGEGVRLS